jgi:solute carrier family 35 protein
MSLSMLSVRGVNLPMYTTLRRTTAAFTMLAEYALAGKTQPPAVARAVAVTCVGAALAGAADASFDAKGYALVFACNAATAAYLACIARVGKRTGLNAFGLMWCNGVMAAPVLAAVALLDGDAAKAAAYVRRSASAETDLEEAAAAAATGLVPGSGSGSGVAGLVASPSPPPGAGAGGLFFALVLASCALAFGLNYAIFLNTAVNSALTQTVCGNLKDVAVIAIGFNAFGGVRVDPRNVAGMGLGILGSIMYAREKLRAPTRGAKAT